MQDRGFNHATLAGLEQPGDRNGVANVAAAAGRLLAAPDGPRIAAMEGGGWDTHAQQMQRLTYPLKQLDAALVALKAALGPAWAQTAVLVMTEFGRTPASTAPAAPTTAPPAPPSSSVAPSAAAASPEPGPA